MRVKTIADLAKEVSEQFVTDTRDNGEKFVHLKDGRPDWMQDLAHEAHGDMFPDDWRYEFIREAVDAIHENDGDEDSARDSATEPDTYNNDLMRWASSHGYRFNGYCDEAAKEGNDGFIGIVGRAQEMEKSEVFDAVWSFLSNMVDEQDDTNEEE